ncbi:MAG: hypothetical protein QG661_1810 [Actinomycetota bacterium]|nr:hypothetical protein [Actinomycetota bacterium]
MSTTPEPVDPFEEIVLGIAIGVVVAVAIVVIAIIAR